MSDASKNLTPGDEYSKLSKTELVKRLLGSERDVLSATNEAVRLRKQLDEQNRRLQSAERTRDGLVMNSNVIDEMQTLIRGALPALRAHARTSPAPVKSAKGVKVVDETLILHVSDEHFGQVVAPESVGGLERYNIPIALRRAETYVDNVIEFATRTLSNYRFSDVVMLFYGDHVNGDIHNAQEYSHLRNSFATCLGAGQMHAQMIRDIAAAFPGTKVRAFYVPGNHGRQTKHKDYNNPLRNQDFLVGEVAASLCRDIPDVEFTIAEAFSVNIKIYNYVFNVSHGDDVKAWNGIPWYGIERRTRRLQAIHAAKNETISYKVMGHFHQASSSSDPVGETIINGSWKATDEWLYNAIGGYCKPVQWIHGVHERHGITWRLPVDLRSDGEESGPRRYQVTFAADCYNKLLAAAKV